MAKFDNMKPDPLPTAMSVSDGDGQAPQTCVLAGGNYLKPGQEVTPGFPAFLGASEPEIAPPEAQPKSTGRRSALAQWLTRPDHPLTARVMINRIWQYHFGQGIVATPNDFGVMGGNPSHPELLDWLASELVADGWHLKPIHRLMVLSATYCQSSQVDPKSPDCMPLQWLPMPPTICCGTRGVNDWKAKNFAMPLLQIAGQLNLRMYGPSAQPELPQVLADTRYGWDPDKNAEDRNRRSIYVLAKRNMRLPLLQAFDQPDMLNSCPRRTNTTTAPQALEMLNGESTADAARQWGGKLLSECGEDEAKLVREAYADAYGRSPKDAEVNNGGTIYRSAGCRVE